MNRLFVFGLGYTAKAIVDALEAEGYDKYLTKATA